MDFEQRKKNKFIGFELKLKFDRGIHKDYIDSISIAPVSEIHIGILESNRIIRILLLSSKTTKSISKKENSENSTKKLILKIILRIVCFVELNEIQFERLFNFSSERKTLGSKRNLEEFEEFIVGKD